MRRLLVSLLIFLPRIEWRLFEIPFQGSRAGQQLSSSSQCLTDRISDTPDCLQPHSVPPHSWRQQDAIILPMSLGEKEAKTEGRAVLRWRTEPKAWALSHHLSYLRNRIELSFWETAVPGLLPSTTQASLNISRTLYQQEVVHTHTWELPQAGGKPILP